MKISKIISISIKRAKRNRKRNIILMLPLTIILVLLFIVNMIQYSMEEYIESMENNIELRTIEGINYSPNKYEETVQTIKNMEHVQMVVGEFECHIFASKYCKEFITDKTDGKIEIKPANNKACPEVIKGRKIEDNDKYVIIIPSRIYANSLEESFKNQISNKEYIDGKNLIGKKISIEFELSTQEKVEKTFEIIGVYDSDMYYDNFNTYIPMQVIKELNEEFGHEASFFQLQVVVDKFENIERVEKRLYEEGISSKSEIQQESEINEEALSTTQEANIATVIHVSADTQRLLKKIILYLIVAILIILVIILIVTNINKTYLSTAELAILKVEGYTNKDIQKITIIENIIICIISIVIALVGFQIIKLIINIIFYNIISKEIIGLTAGKIQEQIYYVTKIPQKISAIFILVISIIVIGIETLNTYLTNKRILAQNIAEMLEK